MTSRIKSNPTVVKLKSRSASITRTIPDSGQPRGPKKPGHAFHTGSKYEGPPAIRKEVDPDSIASARVSALGKRFRIDSERGFFLDDVPASLDAVMLETNRIRKANGLAPVGKKAEWMP